MNAERVAEMLAADPYAALLGIELESVSDDRLAVSMPVDRRHVNFLEVCHGGATFSLADVAFSLASNQAGPRAVAVDTHLVLTAAGRVGDRLTAEAIEVTRGRTLGTYQVTVRRSDGRTVGLFTGTVHISS